jgi:dipeptidase D
MSSDKSSKLTIFSNKRKQNEPPIPIIKEKSMEKKDLKPAGVFKYFEEICQVPRPSKKEEKMIAYLKTFGAKHNLETKVDEAGNVLIKKPATPGKENLQTVVLQSHIDMVCEKNNDVQHDFLTDPIETEIDGEWLKAKGTTLGADNGIGVATELAILADDSIEHGPLECLFTVDEETGLTGAFALQEGFMSGDILLNLDSEDEGEIFIGCAGGIDSVAEFTYKEVEVPAGYFFFKVEVKGLKGGHSGGDIHLGRGNANKILNRFLSRMAARHDLYLCEINGGNLRNATLVNTKNNPVRITENRPKVKRHKYLIVSIKKRFKKCII